MFYTSPIWLPIYCLIRGLLLVVNKQKFHKNSCKSCVEINKLMAVEKELESYTCWTVYRIFPLLHVTQIVLKLSTFGIVGFPTLVMKIRQK